MSDCRKYVDYIMEQAKNLLAIDSPSGYGREVTEYLLKELEALGVQARRTVARALARKVEDGALDLEAAERTARRLLHDNAIDKLGIRL